MEESVSTRQAVAANDSGSSMNGETQKPVTSSQFRRAVAGRWFHPYTKFYVHAFIDCCICWVIGLCMKDTLDLAIHDRYIPHDYQANVITNFWLNWVTRALPFAMSMISGIAIGNLMQVIGHLNLRVVGSIRKRRKKYVDIGCAWTPLWVFVCLAIVLSMAASLLANGAVKGLFVVHVDGKHSTTISCNYYWFAVLMGVCSIDLAAVACEAFIRSKLLRDQEKERCEGLVLSRV